MNPARALAKWIVVGEPERALRASSGFEAARAWSRATGVALDPERTVVGPGVRELLSAVLECGVHPDQELWLPADVYPVYWELAQRGAVRPRSFPTLPCPDWSFLAQTAERAAVVVPLPLSPLGRALTGAEEDVLLHWLHESKHRLLIVDAVYTYDFARNAALTMRVEGQCVVLWSCSKSWLTPNHLGLATCPADLASSVRARVSPPSPTTLGSVTALLESRPELPQVQQEAFHREWRRLDRRIRAVVHDWEAPSSGYFSVAAASFEHLLEHGILAVPASVFGAQQRDLSVVTCLHDLALHEERSVSR
jgi:aspartate/methionine/tyrosine aminotransferase